MSQASAHWENQRLSSVLLLITLPCLGWLLYHYGHDYHDLRHIFSNPLAISALALCTISTFYHGFLGFQVIIEDYVPNKSWRYFLIKAAQLKMLVWGIVSLFCIIKIFTTGN